MCSWWWIKSQWSESVVNKTKNMVRTTSGESKQQDSCEWMGENKESGKNKFTPDGIYSKFVLHWDDVW